MLTRYTTRAKAHRDHQSRNTAALLTMVLAFFASFALFAPDQAKAQSRNTVSAIEVDVSELRARGVGVLADLLHDALRAELQARYTIAADAPRLQVSLNSFFLNSDTSIGSGGGSAFGMDRQPPVDNLGGEARLIGRDGRVIDSYRLVANNPSTTARNRPTPLREQLRARALAEVFAGWVARRY
jgi:hypothetical protein